ncbi:efflux RND transporter periplasmic adaptor subunit [Verrucomicrobiota bacterium]
MKKTMNSKLMILSFALCALTGIVSRAQTEPEGDSHDHSGGQGYQNEGRVPVTQEQVARLDIKITRAARGIINRRIRVPGEIKVNSDLMAHVVPQSPGVVQQVSAVLGQQVKKGQVLAVISSRDLAEAKARYLASVERLKLAQDTFNREKALFEKKVSPEQDFLAARQALAETKILERSARQKLITFGVNTSSLPQLEAEPEKEFASYRIVAPLDGTVIEKHIVQGEILDEKAKVFVVADLSSVWVDFAISQDAISSVRKGHTVTISLPDGTKSETKIEFVSPLVASDTRTALARAVLKNPTGRFRPGTFVEAGIHIPSGKEAVLIPKTSVQLVHDHPCVFVWGDAAFEVRVITTGVTDGQQIEVLTGLHAGEAVASENAFHLKAEFIKSASGAVGAHHGHSH